jgi:Predicted membrane protein (DUF2142)
LRAQRLTRPLLAGGLALIALGIAVTLSRSPLVPAASNGVPARTVIAATRGDLHICQTGEVVPAGTTAIHFSLFANDGPRLTAEALAGGRVLTRGVRGSGWGVGEAATVPVARVARTVRGATVCVTLGPSIEPFDIFGDKIGSGAGKGNEVEMRIEYLRSGGRSWWSLIPAIARRIGYGRAPSGAWSVALPAALMAALLVLVAWLLLRASPGMSLPAGRAVPVAAWACALVAVLSAASWSILTPPFQSPDEPSHFAYVQQLAEARRLPTSSGFVFSPAEELALGDLEQYGVHWHPLVHTISTGAQEHRLQVALAKPLSRRGSGDASVAASEPPLYYALETVPYGLGASGTLLDQLALMRLLSALLAGVTAFFAFLFVREALPGAPWAWLIGGLGVALAPLLGFMSGTVNPDALLYAVSAALFYCLARSFRRGLTPRLALALGGLVGAGLLTKLNFLGLAPGALLGLVLLSRRAARAGEPRAYRALAGALACAAAPVCVYVLVNLASSRAALGPASSTISSTRHGSLLAEGSYIWQLYLPRLPGMKDYFPGLFTTRQIWFDRSVGLYGWLDTSFPGWVYDFALIPAAVTAALCLRGLLAGRAALRHRLVELAVYALIGGGVLLLVGADSYAELSVHAGGYGEPRYLLPMIPLFAAALALAARGAGRRWGPAAGVAIVLLVLAHELFSQLLVISRFYG